MRKCGNHLTPFLLTSHFLLLTAGVWGGTEGYLLPFPLAQLNSKPPGASGKSPQSFFPNWDRFLEEVSFSSGRYRGGLVFGCFTKCLWVLIWRAKLKCKMQEKFASLLKRSQKTFSHGRTGGIWTVPDVPVAYNTVTINTIFPLNKPSGKNPHKIQPTFLVLGI